MDNPLVSIIMGVYNEENTIDTCINSIIRQTYQNWELIICDDCSTDGTMKIIENFQKNDERIIVLHNNQNMKLAASLNNCLKVAKGKYIARMDADDESLPQRLETQIGFLEEHPEYDVVGCNRIIFDENGNRGMRTSVEFPNQEILVKDTPFAHPTIVMKKSVYDALGGYTVAEDTMRAEDLELWFRFYEKGYTGYNLQENLYRYREGVDDLKKRTMKAAVQTSKVFMKGYRRLRFPWYMRVWALKPIFVAIVPRKILGEYYKGKLEKNH